MSEKKAENGKNRSLDKPLYLVGYMGTGKTSVAKELADVLGVAAIDLDDAVVRAGGISIEDVFFRHGEQGFRNRETEQLRIASEGGPAVVACGGGVVLREENRKMLKDTGTVVWLTATPETVYERVKQQDITVRPLIKDNLSVGYMEEHMNEREPAYQEVANLSVSTDDKTPREIAEEIAGML